MVQENRGLSQKIKAAAGMALLLFLALIQLFPLIWLADYSLCRSDQLFTDKILTWPAPFQWNNYYTAIFNSNFFHYLLNSILICVVSISCVVLFSIMAAYACVRMSWKLSRAVSLLILVGMMIPIHATLLPNFLVFSKLKLLDTFGGLMLPYIAFPISEAFFLMSKYMRSVPRSMEEAAVIDGCGIYRLLFFVVTPIMKPSIVTVAILTFLSNWNRYITPMIMLTSNKWKPLPFLALDFTGIYSSDYALQFAVMMLSTLPALIVYISLNRYIVKGLMLGAIKS